MSDYDHLGTVGNHIEVAAYDSAWPLIFQHEARRILEACAGSIVAIEHIGSTAVPNLPAKPLLDIMPGVADYQDGNRTIEPLCRLGYEYRGANGIPGRYYFDLQYEQRSVIHLHLYEVGTENWERHVIFRDYLRTHPKCASQYAALKSHLAIRYRYDRAGYTEAKSGFINDILAQAHIEQRMPSQAEPLRDQGV